MPSAVVADSLAPVWTEAQALTMMHPSQPGSTFRPIAKGFERVEPVTAAVAAKSHNGMEQRLVIRSCPLAQAGQRWERPCGATPAGTPAAAGVRRAGDDQR